MALKIYTKTGDEGKTSLIGGTRVPKSHIRIDAYGTVDELNSSVGLLGDTLQAALGAAKEQDARFAILAEVQDRLFTIGSSLACNPDKEPRMKIPDLREDDITVLEKEIDAMNEVLPPMKSFILPGGHVAVSAAHMARCICRRAERCCVLMQQEEIFIDQLVLKYLNRLSDHLFVLARYTAHVLRVEEIPWKPRVG